MTKYFLEKMVFYAFERAFHWACRLFLVPLLGTITYMTRMRHRLTFLLWCGLSLQAFGKDAVVYSPDKHISLTCHTDKDGKICYAVYVDKQPFILPSRLGIEEKRFNLSDGFRQERVTYHSVNQQWTQPWGENKRLTDNHNEMSVALSNKAGTHLTLRFRVFNDGVGFRYEYKVPQADSLLVMQEQTGFRFADNARSWSIPANFDTYELLYRDLPLSEVKDANTPFTFKTKGGVYGSIHEAALTDYPEMTLTRQGNYTFTSNLAPWPDGVKARFKGNAFQTPWRTIQIARKAVGLINSSLILNLNEPCKLPDTDWVKPMKYVGIWWGMHLGIETWAMDERHGATTRNALKYIDFAAKNNIQGVVFEGWNDGWESWGKGQVFDYTKPYADFDIDKIARYAKEKGVEIIGHHETGGNVINYERQLDEAYRWYAEKGIHCVKTGYAGGYSDRQFHHGQYAVRHYRKVVETAAKYHTTLDVHEPIKDTGIRRTYPNMMTREGGRGMEWNAWSEGNPPTHQVMLPFTRLLAGPMDYTPGTFDILYEKTRNLPTRKKWNDLDKGNSRVNTTLAKQIADWVILYSPLQMASDLIEHYEGHPAFQFFRDFDADCDWSEALQGEPGEFIAVVRRAKDKFFLGAATNEQARTLKIPLSFLKKGKRYKATIYADAADADWKSNPTAYQIKTQTVTSKDVLQVRMACGGGQAVTFIPVNEEIE